MPIKTFCYTVFSLLAFAGNSLFCRMALSEGEIDAASFTVIRLLSGALTLLLILKLTTGRKAQRRKGSWPAALMLFVYALSFSYAYITLDTGTGALVLFASVQLTMIFANILLGKKQGLLEWAGLLIAFAGFVYLVMPEISTPSMQGFVLMAISGLAWGGYTLAGRQSDQPLVDTAYNFLYTLPLATVLVLLTFQLSTLSWEGVVLATLSGALASGLGYTIWYTAVKGLSITLSGVVQLLVPVLAALAGVVFVGEDISQRLIISSLLILGGILFVILGGKRKS